MKNQAIWLDVIVFYGHVQILEKVRVFNFIVEETLMIVFFFIVDNKTIFLYLRAISIHCSALKILCMTNN